MSGSEIGNSGATRVVTIVDGGEIGIGGATEVVKIMDGVTVLVGGVTLGVITSATSWAISTPP